MTQNQASINTQDIAKLLCATPVGQSLKLSQAKALALIEAFVNTTAEALAAGQVVKVHNFGNLKSIGTKARKGKNPQTGEEIQIEASCRPHMVFAKYMKASVKDGKLPEAVPRKAPPRQAKKAKTAAPKASPTKAPATQTPAPPKAGFKPVTAGSKEEL